MKKLIVFLFLFLTFALCSVAYSDILGPQPKPEPERRSLGAAAYYEPNPDTMLNTLGQIVGYLGPREGVFYDFAENEFCNYLAATLYTYKPANVAIDFGVLNLDGGAVTVDWNVGAAIPAENVPLMNILKYLYVGAGAGARYIDDSWQAAYGVDCQIKATF